MPQCPLILEYPIITLGLPQDGASTSIHFLTCSGGYHAAAEARRFTGANVLECLRRVHS